MMRKGIIAGLVLAICLGIIAFLRQPHVAPRHYRIGHLLLSSVDEATFAGFQDAMAASGYVEGENITYVHLPLAEEITQLDQQADELVARGVDLIFVSSTPATLAVKRATAGTRLPVVFAPVNDPLAAGIVSDITHPGGNITGVKLHQSDALRLQLLLEIAPGIETVYIPYMAMDKSALTSLGQVREAAVQLPLRLHLAPLNHQQAIAPALQAIPSDSDAIFVLHDSVIEASIAALNAIALQRRLPLSVPSYLQVQPGALFSYGHDHRHLGKMAARMADQILKGISPADLPVETSPNFLMINMTTADHIGLTVPEHILQRADRIIRD